MSSRRCFGSASTVASSTRPSGRSSKTSTAASPPPSREPLEVGPRVARRKVALARAGLLRRPPRPRRRVARRWAALVPRQASAVQAEGLVRLRRSPLAPGVGVEAAGAARPGRRARETRRGSSLEPLRRPRQGRACLRRRPRPRAQEVEAQAGAEERPAGLAGPHRQGRGPEGALAAAEVDLAAAVDAKRSGPGGRATTWSGAQAEPST